MKTGTLHSAIQKKFGEWGMPWGRVLLFAVVTAVYTALMCLLPFLEDTSFEDIAVYPEFWIPFALCIAVNCRSWWEASLKCFVFFLVSQPLIYLFQVPFYEYGWSIFRYYPRWFFITLLTLPGGAIAYLVKKRNFLSVLILSAANALLAIECVRYLGMAVRHFPRHLLSALYCLLLALFFIRILFDDRKLRLAALAIFAAVLLAAGAVTMLQIGGGTNVFFPGPGEWTYTVEDASLIDVTITDGNRVTVKSREDGTTLLTLTDASGTERYYYVTVSGRNVYVSEFLDE